MSRLGRLLVLALLAPPAPASDDPPLGAPAAPFAAAASIELAPGTALHTRPLRAAPVVTVLDEPAVAELIEERAGWRRLRIGLVTGWLAPAAGSAEAAREPDAKRLARAVALLPAAVERVEVRGLTLHAPAGDERLARWRRVVESTLASWPARLGVPAPTLDGAALVFAPDDPGAVLDEGADPPEAPGSAGGGVAIVRLGARSDEQVDGLLVHELSHLASERTFVRPLPLWLEEGIAEWLAREPLGVDGYGLAGSLRGEIAIEEVRDGRRVDLGGPIADLAKLARQAEAGTLPSLEVWTALPGLELSSPEERSARYALAGSFARFLFEADDERAAAVRETLAAAAERDIDVDEELARRLGDAATLDRAFGDWLVAEFDRQLEAASP